MNNTLPDGSGSVRWMPVGAELHLAYGLLRLTLGVNMLVHGLVRILGGVEVFAAGMTRTFAETMLPARAALVAGAALMIALVFGTALRSDWGAVGGQMLYALIYALLLAFVRVDTFSLDALRARRRAVGAGGDPASAPPPASGR